jgi:hypothetical protein
VYKHQIGIAIQEHLDLFQVANLGRIMHLTDLSIARRSKATQSQSDQHDGSAAGNWVVEEPATK